MRTAWNEVEDDALQGLPLRAQIIYLRGIRRYMDYASGVCGGPQRRISLGMLAEIAQESLNRQILPKATKDAVRASLEQLKRAGLIERLPDPDYLLFGLPLADKEKSASNKYPTTAPQPATADRHSPLSSAVAACHQHQPPTTPPAVAANRPTHQASGNQDLLTLPDGSVAAATPKPGKSAPPYQAIVALYHECLPVLPKVYKLNDARRRHMKALWDEELDDLASWGNYFRHIARSDFLMGRSSGRDGTAFLASFDFIIHPAKFIKIAEEQYHGKKIQRR